MEKETILRIAAQLLTIIKKHAEQNSYAVGPLKDYYEPIFEEYKGNDIDVKKLEQRITDTLEHFVGKKDLPPEQYFSNSPQLTGLAAALSTPRDAHGPNKDHPLFVYVMGDQKAYLHQGNAKNVQEAMEQLKHITPEEAPIAILKVTSCKMFRMEEVSECFCPACGATGKEACDCNCAK